MEEEHADLLASHSLQGRCRARNPAETGSVSNRSRPDDEERHVAHRRHWQTGLNIANSWYTNDYAEYSRNWVSGLSSYKRFIDFLFTGNYIEKMERKKNHRDRRKTDTRVFFLSGLEFSVLAGFEFRHLQRFLTTWTKKRKKSSIENQNVSIFFFFFLFLVDFWSIEKQETNKRSTFWADSIKLETGLDWSCDEKTFY